MMVATILLPVKEATAIHMPNTALPTQVRDTGAPLAVPMAHQQMSQDIIILDLAMLAVSVTLHIGLACSDISQRTPQAY